MIFYRYEDVLTTEGVRLYLIKYKLVKKTPKGYWICHEWESDTARRWVSATARKRFAYPTEKEAIDGFIARKKRQIKILEANLRHAKVALNEGEIKCQTIT